jgi:D-3-phosphoglycerate dehydrogenase/C-terminal binding protein
MGIPVDNVPDYGTNDVADHTMAMLLALCRRLPVYYDALRQDPVGAWVPETGGEVRRLTGATIGIVGLGRIGTAVAVRARAFGMRVVFYDPYLPDGFDKSLQVERIASLEELVAASDFISIHAPLTPETATMIDYRVLSLVKPGATLINTARGGIVCLDAVYRALRNNRLSAFAADVLETEPPDHAHPLIRAFHERAPWLNGRMLLTPHAAFFAVESRIEMRRKSAQRMLDAVSGVPLRNCVNASFLRNPRAAVLPAVLPPWEVGPRSRLIGFD